MTVSDSIHFMHAAWARDQADGGIANKFIYIDVVVVDFALLRSPLFVL